MINTDWKKFIITFFITASLFATGIYFSNYLSNRKINQIRDMQDKISIDILSSETRFTLLKQLSCEDLSGDSILSDELASVGTRLEFLESKLGATNGDVLGFKKYYSILEIKDYILMNEMSARCKLMPHFILYFYSNNSDCAKCEKEGMVLSALREKYPKLRIYSFDYNLDLSSVRALISIYKIKNSMPAMVINGQVFYDYKSVEDIEKMIPDLLKAETGDKVINSSKTSIK